MMRRATTLMGSCPSVRQSVCSVLATQVSTRGIFQARASEEMPLKGLADSIGDAFGPALDAIAEAQRDKDPLAEEKIDVYVPSIPHLLPVTRMVRDNEKVRDVLVFDENKRMKPRLSWYDPYDTTWVPNGWFTDGIRADMDYYFGAGGGGDKAKEASHVLGGGATMMGGPQSADAK